MREKDILRVHISIFSQSYSSRRFGYGPSLLGHSLDCRRRLSKAPLSSSMAKFRISSYDENHQLLLYLVSNPHSAFAGRLGSAEVTCGANFPNSEVPGHSISQAQSRVCLMFMTPLVPLDM